MTLGSPGLDHLADGVPGRVDGATGDAASQRSFTDHFALRELVVQFGLHHISPFFLGFVDMDLGRWPIGN